MDRTRFLINSDCEAGDQSLSLREGTSSRAFRELVRSRSGGLSLRGSSRDRLQPGVGRSYDLLTIQDLPQYRKSCLVLRG
jgi:hypothetical protein